MIDAAYMTPEVPNELGPDHAVFFTKDGQEFRIVMAEPDVWVIHRRGTSPDQFQMVLENPDRQRRIFDATGQANGITFSALGHSLSFAIQQFCR